MKTLRFDSIGGASGNMILGALIDLGADPNAISEQLATLGIESFELVCEPVSASGFRGVRLTVNVHDHGHPHRHLSDIKSLINKGALSDRVKTNSIAVFEKLARAEAEVHGTTMEEIHFHEVGAMDSIIDIVGTCIALEILGIEEIIIGPLPIGQGTTQCAHGVIPIPAPATALLLKNHAVIQTDEPFELTTPTGAALLCTLGKMELQPANMKPQTIVNIGTGFGSRKLNSRPNLIRAIIMEPAGSSSQPEAVQCIVLETNIDDTNPELIGSLSDKLLKMGALDVFTTSVLMKKQRQGTLLTVLCKPEDKDVLTDVIFTESTTFGIREYSTQRTCLERKYVDIETQYGKVRIKVGIWKGKEITRAPEHSDCLRCAEANNVPVRTVYEAALQAECTGRKLKDK